MTIEKTTNQLPGILSVIVLPVNKIVTLNDNTITVSPHTTAHIVFSADSGQHQMNDTQSKSGTSYNHNISGFVQGKNTNHQNTFSQLAQALLCVALVQNENGSWIRIGDTDSPLTFSFSFSTTTPGYNITIEGDTLYMQHPVPTSNGQPHIQPAT